MKLYLHIEGEHKIHGHSYCYPIFTYIWKSKEEVDQNGQETMHDIVTKFISEYNTNVLNKFQLEHKINDNVYISCITLHNNDFQKLMTIDLNKELDKTKMDNGNVSPNELGLEDMDDIFVTPVYVDPKNIIQKDTSKSSLSVTNANANMKTNVPVVTSAPAPAPVACVLDHAGHMKSIQDIYEQTHRLIQLVIIEKKCKYAMLQTKETIDSCIQLDTTLKSPKDINSKKNHAMLQYFNNCRMILQQCIQYYILTVVEHKPEQSIKNMEKYTLPLIDKVQSIYNSIVIKTSRSEISDIEYQSYVQYMFLCYHVSMIAMLTYIDALLTVKNMSSYAKCLEILGMDCFQVTVNQYLPLWLLSHKDALKAMGENATEIANDHMRNDFVTACMTKFKTKSNMSNMNTKNDLGLLYLSNLLPSYIQQPISSTSNVQYTLNNIYSFMQLSVSSVYAECHYGLQKPQDAVAIVNNYMVQAETMGHSRMLIVYSRIAIECGNAFQEGLSATLKCMVAVNPTGTKLTCIDDIDWKSMPEYVYSSNLQYDNIKLDMHTILLSLLMLDCKDNSKSTPMPLFSKVLPVDIHSTNANNPGKAPFAIAAYAYIAEICKEHGAIPLALKIYHDQILTYFNNYTKYIVSNKDATIRSVPIVPYVMNYIITYVHFLEMTGDLLEALQASKTYLEYFVMNYKLVLEQYRYQADRYKQEILVHCRIIYLTENYLSIINKVLNDSSEQIDVNRHTHLNWIKCETTNATIMESTKSLDIAPHNMSPCTFTSGTAACANTTNEVDGYSGYFNLTTLHPDSNTITDSNALSNDFPQVAFTNELLDTLAMGFTLAKIIFLLGSRHSLRKGQFEWSDQPQVDKTFCYRSVLLGLYQVIEPTRINATIALHKTLVRNEHAYYQTIGCLLALSNPGHNNVSMEKDSLVPMPMTITPYYEDMVSASPGPGSGKPGRVIYVLGDSHVLPLAWQHCYGDNSVTDIAFVPRLVTGVKYWHLREFKHQDKNGKSLPLTSSQKALNQFYPKVNFNHVLDRIPSNSEILWVIGEIDCREGIINAVQKGLYDTIEEGIECTVDIAINTIKTVLKQKQAQSVYVHPVLPVMNQTRPVVMRFNEIFKNKLQKSKLAGVYWLEFEHQLVNSENELCVEYRMDGTHINPKHYISLVVDGILKHSQ